ncbi:toll/interleukin-1 receptor domain-containing protein [Saccharothrix deserti]|uniref:toll/interleukin-1 receptor domain-containing protein n=1 Tax=Saccharothrix deserti TaxID=2593674 RepID=UPI00131C2D4A|nr:toll/interleukin-1 receptor domain-containing protein [Saccharothrix deserti]
MPDEVIFVNYRQNGLQDGRVDRLPHVQVVEAVAERLRRHFGEDQVFLDTGIRAGEHYPDALRGKLDKAELLIVVLHRDWLGDLKHRMGQNGVDWVRYEIRTALEDGKHILPVLIERAGLPDLNSLPEDIRPFALKQLRRIDFGHWERDVRLLIQEVEDYLSPVRLPERVPAKIATPRRWVEVPAAWLAGAPIPFVATTLLVPELDRAAWLAALAGTCVFLLFIFAGTAGFVYGMRKIVDRLDEESSALPRDLKVNVIIGVVIFGFAVVVISTIPATGIELRMIIMGVVLGIVVIAGMPWLLNFRAMREWPRPELEVTPSNVRGTLNEVAHHLKEHAPTLNRLQRDQAYYALDQVEDIAALLRELAGRSRTTWLRAAAPWLTLGHALLVGACVGTAVASLGVYWSHGWSHWSAPVWCAAGVVSGTALYLAAIEVTYRLQRWRIQTVLETVPEKLARLRDQVDQSSISPPPKKHRDTDVHIPTDHNNAAKLRIHQ